MDYAKEHRHKLVAQIILEMENGVFNERKYDGMTPDEIAEANRFWETLICRSSYFYFINELYRIESTLIQ